jgi:hypothetical protein
VYQGLLPIAYPASVTIRGVRFAMLDLGDLVDILVTHAALDRIDDPAVKGGDDLARFAKHRDRLEHVANAKFIRGAVEPDGSIEVLPGDLQALQTSAKR